VLKMDDKQFDKHMALLKKSYERMESQLDPQRVLQQIEVEDETRESLESINMVRKPSAKWQKLAVWIASIASVLLVGILISSYMFPPSAFVQSDEEKIESTYEDWLSSLQKKYQEKREKTRIELNIPEEYFKKLSFVESAEYKYNDKAKNKKIVLNKLAYDPKYLTQLEQEILDSLHTPRELIERIETYENPMSFGESRYFFSIYYHPMKEVLQYYTNELSQYNKVLSQKKKDYPKELNQLIATAKKQYFELSYDGQNYSFRTNPIFMKDAPVSIDRLHPDVLGYFKYLATGSLFNGEDLRFSAEESARILKLYERTLVNDLSNSYLDLQLRNLKKEFENGWLVLLKGIDDKIRYSPEHIKLLNDTANGKYGESMRLTAQFILEEFKREGTSKTIDKLTRQDIGIELSYLSNEVYIEIYDGSTGLQIDTRWIIQTEGLYNAYTSSKDDTILD